MSEASNAGQAPLEQWSQELATEIDQLKRQISELETRLAAAEERQSLVNRLLELEGISTNQNESAPGWQVRPNPSNSTSAGGSAGSELEDAVASILEESGTPLHIADIRARLIEMGVSIPGRGEDANIIVRLRKADERFTRTARGTYGIAAWGMPSIDGAKKAKTARRSKR